MLNQKITELAEKTRTLFFADKRAEKFVQEYFTVNFTKEKHLEQQNLYINDLTRNVNIHVKHIVNDIGKLFQHSPNYSDLV